MRKFLALAACLLFGMAGYAAADQSLEGLSVDASIFFEGISQDLGEDASAEYLNGRGRFNFSYTKGDYKGVLKLEIGEFLGDRPLGTTTTRDAAMAEIKHLYISGPVVGSLTLTAGLQPITLGHSLIMAEDYIALNFGYRDHGLAFVTLDETLYDDSDSHAAVLYYNGTFGGLKVMPYLIYARYAEDYDSVGAASSGDGDLFWIAAPISVEMGRMTFDAEFDYMSGSKSDYAEIAGYFRDVDYDAYALWARCGVDLGKAQLLLEAGYGTGDEDPLDDENTAFTPIDEDMTFDIVWEDNLGRGLSNLLFAKVGADFTPREAVTLGAAIIFEQFSEGADKGIGTELDFTAAWDVTESTVLSAGLGYLFAGDAFEDDMYQAYWNLEFNY
jgi:opacity protein-like surface antigen